VTSTPHTADCDVFDGSMSSASRDEPGSRCAMHDMERDGAMVRWTSAHVAEHAARRHASWRVTA